jgi:uncharacterized protein YggT (Ycf19 family)
MAVIDSILNLACVLLWLNSRSIQLAASEKPTALSLASTLKKAGPRQGAGWVSLGVLVAVLGLRSLFYWNVGSAMNWTPSLHLGVVSLPFRSDYLARLFLFSFLSFALLLALVYAWLLLFSIVNRRLPNEEPFQRFVRVQLGAMDRWPVGLRLMLPMLFTTLVWGLASPGLVQLGILPAPLSAGHRWQQALVLGLASFLSWKILIVALCLFYMINSYVYVGNSALWSYLNKTGSNLLRPLRQFPLCIGKLDFAPLVAIGLVLGLTHGAAQWLPWAFQRLPL